MTHHLTPAEAERYRRDGYLCPIDVLNAKETGAARAALETVEQDCNAALPEPVNRYLRSGAHVVLDFTTQIARDPRILDRVETILGPDILLWGAEFFTKEARTRQIVSWHQDLTYWGMDGSDHEVTAWLALSPATAQSGCMKFVPGSHTESLVPHTDTFAPDNLLSRGQEIAVDVDEEDAIAAELQPGQMSLHHGRLFHASGPNTTDDRRIGLVMRFIRPDTPSTGSGRDYAMLMRGVDRVGTRNVIAPSDGRFTPSQLALYAEIAEARKSVLADGLESADDLYSATSEVAHV